jgi:pimeloyl-ACP methyl ester carboxylesterase
MWTPVGSLMMHARVARHSTLDGAPVVVMVHGLGVSSRYMVPTAARLASACRVYAPDLPGFGKSSKPTEVLDVPGLADALHDWMRACGLPRATLLGNSCGCQVLVDLAMRFPECVERLVLVGPTTDPSRRGPWEFFPWLLNAAFEPPSLPLVLLRDVLNCGLLRVVGTFRNMLRDRVEDKLPVITAPTLVVRGGKDPIVSQAWAEDVARRLPKGRLVVLPTAGHAVNYNAPADLAALVREFVVAQSPLAGTDDAA